jgi:hypothetical protein
MARRTEVLSVEEAEELYEAAQFARNNSWHINHLGERLALLNSAVRKLRRADTLHIQQED